ncbi:MAG TPA: lyase family protein [Pilimelia sp.]|nr:lyase family protein [Pilimelia sp.]
MADDDKDPMPLTGRISAGPDALLRREILEPQLRFEAAALLPSYVRVERVLLLEYHRLGLLDWPSVAGIAALLAGLDRTAIVDAAAQSMTDIAFTVERQVEARLDRVPPAWHVDRSRNDLQATAQLLYGRERIVDTARLLVDLGRSVHRAARATTDLPMPGHTHFQAAQVVSPGFHLAAWGEQVQHTLDRLVAVYRTADACPLGAGAMAGSELAWDRGRMARLLGFSTVARHALRAVAQRDWAIEACAEFAMLGVALSRFVTDLLTWSGAGHGFLDLPDDWSGISSAMPQKKNFPVLERLRARTAHLTAAFVDLAAGQRSTPYSNSIEVSKEAAAGVPAAFDTVASVLRLLTAVVDRMRWRADRMRAACAGEYLGGFTLANQLTLAAGVPWRTAQVIAGRYVTGALDRGLTPDRPDPALLDALLAAHGHRHPDTAVLLASAMDPTAGLWQKTTTGSTHPGRVRAMLADQRAALSRAARRWEARAARAAAADEELARLLTGAGPAAGSAC